MTNLQRPSFCYVNKDHIKFENLFNKNIQRNYIRLMHLCNDYLLTGSFEKENLQGNYVFEY